MSGQPPSSIGLVHPIVIVEVVDPILKGGSNDEGTKQELKLNSSLSRGERPLKFIATTLKVYTVLVFRLVAVYDKV